jgi:NTP pyrophosphatase (non-canonical NTP hydrolase)
VGDALYSLLALAQACGVDAELALREALAKVERRLAHHGDAGST